MLDAAPRILLVDDSEALLADYRRILDDSARAGDDELDAFEQLARGLTPNAATATGPRYDLVAATQGTAAIAAATAAAAEGHPFSVVFLDVRMPPGIDGVETALRLWQQHPDLEIVLCSAHNDYSWDDLARILGRTDRLLVLRKPFDAIEVRQLSASLTEKWRRGRELARHVASLDAAIKAEVEARLAERRRFEAELARTERLEMLGRLSAGLLHEISTPAQCVTMCLELLAETLSTEVHLAEAREVVHDAQQAIARIGALAARMRAHVRHEPASRPRPVDLDAEIRGVAMLANGEVMRDAELVLDLGSPPPVVCDAMDVSQAVLNLVINGVHAIRERRQGRGPHGKITLQTRRVGDQVEIAVADTGAGIKPEHRDKILDPFFTTKPVGQGTGQGLAIVRACVVDRHKGELAFDTEVGRGTTFRIRLPLG